MTRVNGFNDRDTQRIARTVRTVERAKPQSLGGGSTARRGGGIVTNEGTVQGQCYLMNTDHQAAWGFIFMVAMS